MVKCIDNPSVPLFSWRHPFLSFYTLLFQSDLLGQSTAAEILSWTLSFPRSVLCLIPCLFNWVSSAFLTFASFNVLVLGMKLFFTLVILGSPIISEWAFKTELIGSYAVCGWSCQPVGINRQKEGKWTSLF